MLRDRHAQLHRQALGELGDQRAESLAAERIDVALERAGEVHRRDLVEILAAAERPEREFDRRLPVAEILRQRLRAGHIALARARHPGSRGSRARSPRDSPPSRLRAHCGARCAASAPAAPDRRRGRSRAGELRHRIEVRHVQPVRAAIVGHAEGAVSVKQRPPVRSLASISAKRRPAAATLRAAAMPAAPAPMIATSVSPEAATAPSAGAEASAAEPARKMRRSTVMVSRILPRAATLPDRGIRKHGVPANPHAAQRDRAAQYCVFVHRWREPKRNGS